MIVQAPDVRLVIGHAVRQARPGRSQNGTHAPPPVAAYTWGSHKNISSFFVEVNLMTNDGAYSKPKIETGVPIPSRNKYPWLTGLEVGDSFLWPAKDKFGLSSAAYKRDVNISFRKIDDETYRVWVVK